jgi:valyl-tRNA synthetase
VHFAPFFKAGKFMEKTYNPKYIEQHWEKTWEEAGYFSPSGKGDPYCIVIPPPNVTGSLHMGHGFQHSLMDVLVRYHRMCGFNTLWQTGVDHAGIATQMVVTQQLITKGIDPYQLSREKFEQYVWEWKEQSRNGIDKQMRRIGVSVDWSRERFTMDEGFTVAVQKVFIDLYEEGLIYRGQKLVNWDPVLCTAISDLEVVFEEREGSLWYIRYPLEESQDYIVVATTRPETMLGDTAIAVNPEDERFKHLIGKYAFLPLTERRLPIIADEYVDPEFGAGCLKITPAHDFNDYAIGKRHDLPLINIFTAKAHLNENVPKVYQGLDRFIARKKIVEDLKNGKFLVKIEPYKLKVPKCDRTDAIIEPYLTDQWFMHMKGMARPAIEAVTSGAIKFIPENWSKTYLQWLENIEDWCISRQLWWGHRVPVWYDEAKKIYVGANEVEVRRKYKLTDSVKLKQDNDVLDTWFSAALWPFVTLGWPQRKAELKKFYPTSVLVTGFDIIFFWIARMVMMGLKLVGELPFKEVYITGLIRDSEGQKMSKSRGNVLDPIDLVDGISLEDLIAKRTKGLMQQALAKKIEQATRREFPFGIKGYGTDALRFTYCALASTGRDINFDISRLEGYRNFCNKIWNASRFVLMQPGVDKAKENVQSTLADRWIVSRLQMIIKETQEAISIYRFDLLAQTLYDFIWHEYCDWYLELCKTEKHVSHVMVTTLETILRLIHPIMPFISEEIWQQVGKLAGKEGATIMLQPYPKIDNKQNDEVAIAIIEWLKKIVIGIRNIRGEMDIASSKSVQLLLKKGSAADKKMLKQSEHYLAALANLESIDWVEEDAKIQQAATALVGDLELYIPFANLIDSDAEQERLNKEIGKLRKDIELLSSRLNNADFVEKAPQNIVQNEKARLHEKQAALKKLLQRCDIGVKS